MNSECQVRLSDLLPMWHINNMAPERTDSEELVRRRWKEIDESELQFEISSKGGATLAQITCKIHLKTTYISFTSRLIYVLEWILVLVTVLSKMKKIVLAMYPLCNLSN